jgi:hypothetical protein
MSDQIEVHRVRKYASGIDHLAQQRFTRLRDKVRVESDVNAKISFWDQIDGIGMQQKTGRHTDTPNIDMPHRRRSLTTNTYETGALVGKADINTVLNDPTGAYGQSMAMASGRQFDDTIIASADATAFTGENGTTQTVLPASQIDITGTIISLDKILIAKRTLDINEVDPSQTRIAVTGANQYHDLLSDATITSSDFNSIKALVQGELNMWVGFNWERSERLLFDVAGTRKSLFYAQNSILLGVASDVEAHVDPRIDKSYDIQVYYAMTIGATRMDETGVVVMHTDE